jgi:2-polyprenyl-3-methyl-5-hydroxy-6-metoxy-1,4-benzoquinol methylase
LSSQAAVSHSTDEIEAHAAPDCLICGRPGISQHTELRDRIFDVPRLWQHRTCRRCHLTWLDPRPTKDSIGALYREYFTVEPGPAPPSSPTRAAAHARALRALGYSVEPVSVSISKRLIARSGIMSEIAAADVLFLPNTEGGKVLDVGCGGGQLLATLQALGWEVAGLEPEPRSAAAAARLLQVPIFAGGIETADLPPAHYDAIVMSHVFEHLPDPVDALRRCAAALKPGGRLYLLTPNTASLGRRIFGTRWLHWDVPRHIFIYDAQSLRLIAEMAGLHVVELRTIARKARWSWRASRMIGKSVRPTDESLPSARADKLAAAGFQLLEHALKRFVPVGEELLLVAGK